MRRKIIDPKLQTYVVLENRSPKHILAYRVTAVSSLTPHLNLCSHAMSAWC